MSNRSRSWIAPSRDLLGEVVGTALLVGIGKSTGISATLKKAVAGQPADSLTVGLTFGFTLVVLALMFPKSHFNPAVTFGKALLDKAQWATAPSRMVAQVLGSVLSALYLWAMIGKAARDTAHLGASLPAPGTHWWQPFMSEGGGAFILVLAVLLTGIWKLTPLSGAVAAGFALVVGVLFAGPVSGGALNPAVYLGPAIVNLKFDGVATYIIAPLVTAGLAAAIAYLFKKEQDNDTPSYKLA